MDLTLSTNLTTPGIALAVGAHPDDIELGCGATLAKWAGAGCAIHHLVCTDGSKGSWDPQADPEELAQTRRREQQDAHLALGGHGKVIFLARPDGELAAGIEERAELCSWIRRIRPDVVLGHDPWKRYRLHPDHRQAGFLLTAAVVAARDPLFFPEQDLAPHRPGTMLLWEADEVDHVEDVSGWSDRKADALLCHRSQWLPTMGITNPGAIHDVESFRSRLLRDIREAGALAGLAAGEAFKILRDL